MTTETVATFLDRNIEASGKSATEIARECGFAKPNVISMIRYGRTRLPIARAPKMASALGISARTLVEMAFREYEPEYWKVIESLFLSGGDSCEI